MFYKKKKIIIFFSLMLLLTAIMAGGIFYVLYGLSITIDESNIIDEDIPNHKIIDIADRANFDTDSKKVYSFEEGNDSAIETENIRLITANEDVFIVNADAEFSTYDLSCPIEKKAVTVCFSRIRTYDYGIMYKMQIESIGDFDISRLLFYFYFTEDKIYMVKPYIILEDVFISFLDKDELMLNVLNRHDKIIENSEIVYQDEYVNINLEDGEWGTKYLITPTEDGVIYSSLEIKPNGEIGFYEWFEWDNRKRLVEYGSGFGPERDTIYLHNMIWNEENLPIDEIMTHIDNAESNEWDIFGIQEQVCYVPEMMYQRQNVGLSPIYAFGSVLFIGRKCYRFEEGRYQIADDSIYDFLPAAIRKQEEWEYSNCRIAQYEDNLVFCLQYYNDGEKYAKVLLTNVHSRESTEVCNINGAYLSNIIYNEKLFFSINEYEQGVLHGESQGARIVCVDLLNLACDTIYVTDRRISDKRVRADGTLVFLEWFDDEKTGVRTGGYIKLLPDGSTQLLHENIEWAKYITFDYYDEKGLYLFYEATGFSRYILLSEQGGIIGFLDGSPWSVSKIIRTEEGIIKFEENYVYASLFHERYKQWDLPLTSEEPDLIKIKDIPLLDKNYIEAGYQLAAYWYDGVSLQCFYEDGKGNLFTKTFPL